jgi:hypothetical protein
MFRRDTVLAAAGGTGDDHDSILPPRGGADHSVRFGVSEWNLPASPGIGARFRSNEDAVLARFGGKNIALSGISAASSEISAEKPVNIVRTHRKIAVPNRIALIRVRQGKSFPSCGFAKDPPLNSRRSPTRNVDASDSHSRI